MKLFSHKNNYKKKNHNVQRDLFDQKTLNKIWDIIYKTIYSKEGEYKIYEKGIKNIEKVLELIYIDIFKKPSDEAPEMYRFSNYFYVEVNKKVYNDLKNMWFNDFNFEQRKNIIEIFCKVMDGGIVNQFNDLFEELLVPYRINSSNMIVSIDSKEEYKEIEKAIENESHMEKALEKLHDREKSDYRNSIKESILAVEEVCKSIYTIYNSETKSDKFSDYVDFIEEKFFLHHSFAESLKNIYKFSSDEKWIRHSGKTESNIYYEDARLILIMCSAIINYLKEKKKRMSNNKT